MQKLRSWFGRATDVPVFLRRAAWHVVCSWHGVASPSVAYQPRIPVRDVLYQVVRDHYESFRAQTANIRDGARLPRFVEEEFRAFLRCGLLAGGFARFRCAGYGLDRLVPFARGSPVGADEV